MKDGQPFATGNAGSELFRIPALITLKNGRVLASADARYGHGQDSPSKIDTVVSYSDDNGKNWSVPQKVNCFNDVECENNSKVVKSSASFIDSALVEDSNGKVYLITNACPAFIGCPTSKKSGSGLIDGRIALCDKTSSTETESTVLDKTHYPYFIGDFKDGYAPIHRLSDEAQYENYYVDSEYNLYKFDGEAFKVVKVPVIGADGELTEKETDANVFYAHSPLKLYPAFYTWLRTSEDCGETWSKPKILNKSIFTNGFSGICPGRGFTDIIDGKERVMFGFYDDNGGTEYTSIIYSDDGGETWNRGERASQTGIAVKSSESQLVKLNDGVIRMYSRNKANYISYTDSTDAGRTWGRYKLDRALKYTSDCMVSFVNYSKKIDGKNAIIAAYPCAKTRKLGVIRIGLFDEDNKVDWKYRYNVTDDITDLTYVYSCLTELPNGNIGLLYESQAFEITYKSFTTDELKRHDKQQGLLKRI